MHEEWDKEMFEADMLEASARVVTLGGAMAPPDSRPIGCVRAIRVAGGGGARAAVPHWRAAVAGSAHTECGGLRRGHGPENQRPGGAPPPRSG